MTRALALALIACAAAGPVLAQTAWTAAPTVADVAAVYPAKAKAEGLAGAADLICTVAGGGRLRGCDVLGETPRGYGFGVAARKLATKLQAAGVTAGQEVRVPVTFMAEAAAGAAMTVKTPHWTAVPTAQEIQAVVPKTEGGPNNARVTLVCGVEAGGVLGGCVVDREEPAGQGFGAAILSLAPKFRADLMSVEGAPTVGAKVRVPVRFELTPVK